eukprot:gene1609-1757_t
MTSFEERLVELEKAALSTNTTTEQEQQGVDGQAVEVAIKKYQQQMLIKLKTIKNALLVEGGDVTSIRQERDAAVTENIALKKEIERLNYRVRHLIKALNEEEGKAQK